MRVMTISQVTTMIKSLLESRFSQLTVEGEISNCTVHSSGHFYFSLKDEHAQLSAVMFKRQVATLAVLPKAGDRVTVVGELTVYPPRGAYQIIVKEMHVSGIGLFLLRFERLKKKLDALGWFAPDRKKALPPFPKKIAVITSPTGAALHDILTVIGRRFSGIHIIINPVTVQGSGAAEDIARAIKQCNDYSIADVIIVGRGGGSIEDLWAFNEEVVAKAIFSSEIPVLSAVGHETDFTIADFVADVRAPTPSAAAELVTQEKELLLRRIEMLSSTLAQRLRQQLASYRERLARLVRSPVLTSLLLTRIPVQRLDELRNALDNAMKWSIDMKRRALLSYSKEITVANPRTKIISLQREFNGYSSALDSAWSHMVAISKEKIYRLSTALDALNPKNVLQKGYSIIFSEKENDVIFSVNNVTIGQQLTLHLSDGTVVAKAKQKGNHDTKDSTTGNFVRTGDGTA